MGRADYGVSNINYSGLGNEHPCPEFVGLLLYREDRVKVMSLR